MKTLIALLILLALSGCASYDYDATAEGWHEKVELGR